MPTQSHRFHLASLVLAASFFGTTLSTFAQSDERIFRAGYFTGNHSDVLQLGFIWPLGCSTRYVGWCTGLETSLGFWSERRAGPRSDGSEHPYDIGLRPNLRWSSRSGRYFADAGIGVHWLSREYQNNGRKLAGQFQFGTSIGVGMKMENGWEFSLAARHLSNGGLRNPNDGINLVGLRAGFTF